MSVRWQSNDGLATPGSVQGGAGTPTLGATPPGSPRPHAPHSVGPKHSASLFSLAAADPAVVQYQQPVYSRQDAPLPAPPGSQEHATTVFVPGAPSPSSSLLRGSSGCRSLQRGVPIQQVFSRMKLEYSTFRYIDAM